MINIIDDFLDTQTYKDTYERLSSNEFKEVVAGDKSFWVQYDTPEFAEMIIKKISSVEGVERTNVYSFFRVATNKVDTDWHIHSDAIINGDRPKRALVLYLSPPEGELGLHGTAFWEHKELGHSLPEDISFDKYDDVLLNESNNIQKWNLSSVVGYKVNRGVCYPCNFFHSKYPNVGWSKGRIVYVMFYK